MRKAVVLGAWLLLANMHSTYSQVDAVGSGRALRFDGIDDFVDLGEAYGDLTYPLTVSCWVFLDPGFTGAAPIFATNDNFNATSASYRGFWFFVTATAIFIEFGDGMGGDNPAYRRGKLATVSNITGITGRWVHAAAVMTSQTQIELYINGINVGGNWRGNSSQPMASSFAGDRAKLGHQVSNNATTYAFKGMLDEFRIYSRSLSVTEIRGDMCIREPSTAGLLGQWNLDETTGTTTHDQSTLASQGQLMNLVSRVVSGAPLGDRAIHRYGATWAGVEVSIENQPTSVTVDNFTGAPHGVHLYEVQNVPNTVDGIEAEVQGPYYGVFVASLLYNCSFDVAYEVDGRDACQLYLRNDNSGVTWEEAAVTSDIFQRTEIIEVRKEVDISVDLGGDVTLCDDEMVSLNAGPEQPGRSFLWNTGATSSSLTVAAAGEYHVTVSQECSIAYDTITVTLLRTPVPFSLGKDVIICEGSTYEVPVDADTIGYEISWGAGSEYAGKVVSQAGTYILQKSNVCGSVSDTVVVTVSNPLLSTPNLITPNGDGANDSFILTDGFPGAQLRILNRWGSTVFESVDYKNDWSADGLHDGVYFYVLKHPCGGNYKGHISVRR